MASAGCFPATAWSLLWVVLGHSSPIQEAGIKVHPEQACQQQPHDPCMELVHVRHERQAQRKTSRRLEAGQAGNAEDFEHPRQSQHINSVPCQQDVHWEGRDEVQDEPGA